MHITNQRALNNYKNIFLKGHNKTPQRPNFGSQVTLWTAMDYRPVLALGQKLRMHRISSAFAERTQRSLSLGVWNSEGSFAFSKNAHCPCHLCFMHCGQTQMWRQIEFKGTLKHTHMAVGPDLIYDSNQITV